MKLYNYFRSGTSHRLRIALHLKGLKTEYIAVDLRHEEHLGSDFKALNPQGLVPALISNGKVLIQSPSIIEWLEETHPTPALLPTAPDDRAYVRALAAIVGCDIHPINNRRILEYLRHKFITDENAINEWCSEWISDGFNAYESMIASDKSRASFSFGNTPTIADVYLIPQIDSARRFKVDLSKWPLILDIETACLKIEAFQKAAPKSQPDAF